MQNLDQKTESLFQKLTKPLGLTIACLTSAAAGYALNQWLRRSKPKKKAQKGQEQPIKEVILDSYDKLINFIRDRIKAEKNLPEYSLDTILLIQECVPFLAQENYNKAILGGIKKRRTLVDNLPEYVKVATEAVSESKRVILAGLDEAVKESGAETEKFNKSLNKWMKSGPQLFKQRMELTEYMEARLPSEESKFPLTKEKCLEIFKYKVEELKKLAEVSDPGVEITPYLASILTTDKAFLKFDFDLLNEKNKKMVDVYERDPEVVEVFKAVGKQLDAFRK